MVSGEFVGYRLEVNKEKIENLIGGIFSFNKPPQYPNLVFSPAEKSPIKGATGLFTPYYDRKGVSTGFTDKPEGDLITLFPENHIKQNESKMLSFAVLVGSVAQTLIHEYIHFVFSRKLVTGFLAAAHNIFYDFAGSYSSKFLEKSDKEIIKSFKKTAAVWVILVSLYSFWRVTGYISLYDPETSLHGFPPLVYLGLVLILFVLGFIYYLGITISVLLIFLFGLMVLKCLIEGQIDKKAARLYQEYQSQFDSCISISKF